MSASPFRSGVKAGAVTLSPVDAERFKADWLSGVKRDELAGRYGLGHARTVQRVAQALGLPRRKPGGATVGVAVIGNAAAEATVRRMWGEGQRPAAIAAALGASERTVQTALLRLNLRTPRRSAPRVAEPPAPLVPCRQCGRPFPSEGPLNLICNACKADESWRFGGEFEVAR